MKLVFKYTKFLCLICLVFLSCSADPAQSASQTPVVEEKVPFRTGAEVLIEEQIDRLKGLKVGLVANHTTMVYDETHLVDTLLALGVELTKIFAPEHGFRGTADAGEKVRSGVDPQTGLPLLSLHGKVRKPTPEMLSDLDLVIFDIQDVGVRHYTYIYTLSYVMEACATQGIKVLVLDRPNPNGWYVDGPMMEDCCTSFIGLHKLPVVHGLTVAEYAHLINEEGWLENGQKVELEVTLCEGYDHQTRWESLNRRWIPPSPNLGTEYSAYLYPILVMFERTPVSIGRGTDDAFTILGAPWFEVAANARLKGDDEFRMIPYRFTPESLPGKSKYPKHQDKECTGYRFSGKTDGKSLFLMGLELIQQTHQVYTESGATDPYFMKSFARWPGYESFIQQIEQGMEAEKIYQSWQADTDVFRVLRKKYLLYEE
ncbi:MAG: DUF1343 domain-containing protein [Bacteroidota bacterium]